MLHEYLAPHRAWKESTPDELAAWIGIVVYMGVHRFPTTRDYWKHDGLNSTLPICDYMSQKRFEQIKRYIYVEIGRAHV